jgi:lysyl endopeptidase
MKRRWLAAGLGLLLAWSAGAQAQPPETFGTPGPPARKEKKPVRPLPSEKMGVELRTVPEVRLPAIDREKLLREDEAARGRGKALRYGVGRDVRISARDGDWYDLAAGRRLWVGEIAATGALGLRLHFKGRLPAGSELAVYAPAETERREIHESFPAGRSEFWTGSFPGERARIEYLTPAGGSSRELPFTVDRLQHLYRDPVADLGKAAGPCHNDVSCYPEWAEVARAVAGIGVAGRDALFCTGELLDDQAGDLTPYWLTAHHCLGTQGKAASAEIYWLYQTPRCGAAPPSLHSVPHSVGATLLATSRASDYTLLMIDGALPDGLFWAGWTAAPVADGTGAAGVHHPRGDYKRISFGFKDEGSACRRLNPNLSLVRVSWTDGPTEPGSSGSGIFRADTHQLFGQLFDGPSACGEETYDCYGAFAATYPQIQGFLRAGTDDDSEPNGSCEQARAVKAGTLRDRIVKAGSPDWYRISVPSGRTATVGLSFRHADGDVDLAAFTGCGGAPVAVSEGAGDAERVSFTNRRAEAADLRWKVYLGSDTRNGYSMAVSIR